MRAQIIEWIPVTNSSRIVAEAYDLEPKQSMYDFRMA